MIGLFHLEVIHVQNMDVEIYVSNYNLRFVRSAFKTDKLIIRLNDFSLLHTVYNQLLVSCNHKDLTLIQVVDILDFIIVLNAKLQVNVFGELLIIDLGLFA